MPAAEREEEVLWLAAERDVDSTVVRVVDVERTRPSLFIFDVVLVVRLGWTLDDVAAEREVVVVVFVVVVEREGDDEVVVDEVRVIVVVVSRLGSV